MLSIFDLVTAPEIAAYWTELSKDMPPYLGEELFPAEKRLGLDLSYIKGAKGLPVVLKPSAFDVKAVPRERIGAEKLMTEMPYFKESLFVDEKMRQELNKVLQTENKKYIESVVRVIFDDQKPLLDGARARREMMRMLALTTGRIDISANGQIYSYDYHIPEKHKFTVKKSWSDTTAPVIDDIRGWMDTIEDDTGERPSRAICTRKTWSYLLSNDTIKKSIFVMSNGQAILSDRVLRQYLMEELGLEVAVYTKRYLADDGTAKSFVPDDTFVLIPSGSLGTTWFGTTPEESDLVSSTAANVSIVDTGVAITTMKRADPVNVETKVSMISLPSFDRADYVGLADVIVS